MHFKDLMIGVSGVRGVIGKGMTPELALLWAGGFGTWIGGGKVVVGRDTRPSGEMLCAAVSAGLSGCGCDVEDVGVLPTPTVALAVEKRGAAGGIIITASHNPQEWNALKFVRSDGRMLTPTDFTELHGLVVQGPLRSVPWNRLGTIRKWDGAETAYLSAVLGVSILNLDRIRKRRFKVVLDAVNGAGSFTYPKLLEALNCSVVPLNDTGSGIFPHSPEPRPEALEDLSRVVKAESADLGFAVDPDGDRLAAVDETGQPIGEEVTLALAIQSVLEITPGPVVVNSLTSQVVEYVAGQYGVPCHRTRVGEANVAVGIKEFDAVAGGEGNGGLIYPALHLVRDAGIAMALVLNRLASGRKTLSALAGALPNYKMVKAAFPLGDRDAQTIIEEVAKFYSHDQVSRADGLRVVYEDGWVQVRASGTEPILRVFAESLSQEKAERYSAEMLEHLGSL